MTEERETWAVRLSTHYVVLCAARPEHGDDGWVFPPLQHTVLSSREYAQRYGTPPALDEIVHLPARLSYDDAAVAERVRKAGVQERWDDRGLHLNRQLAELAKLLHHLGYVKTVAALEG